MSLAQNGAMGLHQPERGVVADRADVGRGDWRGRSSSASSAPQPDRAGPAHQVAGRPPGLRKTHRHRPPCCHPIPARRVRQRARCWRRASALPIPLWVYPQRCSSRTTFSPLAVKRKCPGLDDARMHRTDRDLVQTVALRRQEAVGRSRRQRVDAISERKAHAPTVVGRARGGGSGKPCADSPKRSLTVRSSRSAGG